jgi:polyphosphate kinase 2 (PPK2 family)
LKDVTPRARADDPELTERVSPRVFRLIAPPAPSDREKSQMYMQRYMAHFPAA